MLSKSLTQRFFPTKPYLFDQNINKGLLRVGITSWLIALAAPLKLRVILAVGSADVLFVI